MTVAAVLLAIAALGGVVMAAMRFGGRELPPMALAVIHGLFAASGLVALILPVVNSTASTVAVVALTGFVIAALGGFMLFSYHLRGKALPVNYVAVHGAGAVISFAILLAAIFAVGG
ncbi:MAG: hypothetical protein M3416_11305 [Acidobacteriota bacterium]|nr:hypothetical protein [Acidobacteriota bacterium]